MAKVAINIATGTIQQEEMIVGIDLGTTNSLIAIIHPDTKQPVALKDIDNSTLVPSILHFDSNLQVQVGNSAKTYLESDPNNTIYSVKRLLGKSYEEIKGKETFLNYKIIDNGTDQLVKIQIGPKFYNPIELSSYILKELKDRAEHVLKASVKKCVITVPAYFNDAQRQATRDAGKLAGLEVLRIINEPTAASLAYGFGIKRTDTYKIAVYDLGGGTFDISILQITDGVFDVLSTHGDTHLGGDDFDYLIMEHFIQQLKLDKNKLESDNALAQTLRLTAEKAKKHLSQHDRFESNIQGGSVSITKDEFHTISKNLVQRTLTFSQAAIKDSGLNIEEIDEVIMVGGSTRMPLVKEEVARFFGKEVNDTVNPDEVVALGAAVQADILAGNQQGMLLLDVTPLSLGIETLGGLMDVLIPRNTKIPCKAGRQYTTQKDGQSGIIISVYQGERDQVIHNRKLASFNLSGIPAMPAGLPKVDIQFLIDADGILQVSANELRSGIQQSIEVKPQFGLTDDEVEKMLLDSITNAKEDISIRALLEAITEAEQMIELTQNFIRKHKPRLTKDELEATEQAINNLISAIQDKNKDGIHKNIEQLNEISKPYAERIMDEAVANSLKGKNI